MERNLRILIADDHPIVVFGLTALLSEATATEVVSARDGAGARQAVAKRRPDLAVVNVNLPDMSGFELTRQLLAVAPRTKILIFAMEDDPMLAVRALSCGASAFLSKNDDPIQLQEAIREVSAGNVWLAPDITQEVALIRIGARKRMTPLTELEIEILRMLSRGKHISEIANLIEMSRKTVGKVCTSMRVKLNARTSAELVRIAVQQKLI